MRGFFYILIITLTCNILNLNFSGALFLSVMKSETMDVQYRNKCPTTDERKGLANKKSMIWRVRSGYRSIMRYIMSFLISWLWLKSSVQYEMKNLPWFICVCMCCVCARVHRIFCFLFLPIFFFIIELTVIPSGIWSDHSPLNDPLIT